MTQEAEDARGVELTNLAIAVSEEADEVCTKAHSRLWALNAQLLELRQKIQHSQPVGDGSVCLELYGCLSPKAVREAEQGIVPAVPRKTKPRTKPCLGCPHARWVQYRWIKVAPTLRNKGATTQRLSRDLNAENVDPILVVPAKFKNRAEVRELIREAKSVLKERAELVALLRKLRIFAGTPDDD